MLTFFRKTRKKLADNNQVLKYSRYAIGEIVLVVIGILIALQINNWNEDKKTDRSRLAYLSNLQDEFTYNKEELQRVMKLNERNANSALSLTGHMGKSTTPLSEEACGELIAKSLIAEVQYRPSDGALDEILSSGKLSVFKTEALKMALASWNGALLKIRFQEQEHQNFRLKALGLVHRDGNMKRIYHQQYADIVPIKETGFNRRNLDLLKDPEFESVMSSFYMTAFFLNKPYFSGLESKIDDILLLIDRELNL